MFVCFCQRHINSVGQFSRSVEVNVEVASENYFKFLFFENWKILNLFDPLNLIDSRCVCVYVKRGQRSLPMMPR